MGLGPLSLYQGAQIDFLGGLNKRSRNFMGPNTVNQQMFVVNYHLLKKPVVRIIFWKQTFVFLKAYQAGFFFLSESMLLFSQS